MRYSLFIVIFLLSFSCSFWAEVVPRDCASIFILCEEDSLFLYKPWTAEQHTKTKDSVLIEYKVKDCRGIISFKKTDLRENEIYYGTFRRQRVAYEMFPYVDEYNQDKFSEERVVYLCRDGVWKQLKKDGTVIKIERYNKGQLIEVKEY